MSCALSCLTRSSNLSLHTQNSFYRKSSFFSVSRAPDVRKHQLSSLLHRQPACQWSSDSDSREVILFCSLSESDPQQSGALTGHCSHAHPRVWLFYGQPYGRSPYGRFSDSNSFPFLVIFLSFSDFRNFFLREILEREFFDEKKLETKI